MLPSTDPPAKVNTLPDLKRSKQLAEQKKRMDWGLPPNPSLFHCMQCQGNISPEKFEYLESMFTLQLHSPAQALLKSAVP